MHMSNEDIVKEYREAKDKKEQIKILADLNVCDKQEIIKVLINDGHINPALFVTTPRIPTSTFPKKNVKKKAKEMEVAPVQPEILIPVAAVPEIVKEALSQKMIELQETIDTLHTKKKEAELQMETLYKYIRKCI